MPGLYHQDSQVAVLNDCLGDHSPPREVVEADASEPAPIDVDGTVLNRAGDLIGDSEDCIELVLAAISK